MQAIIFVGIQGSGKSTFYEQRFASTHLRISMDLAGTRAREKRLIERCLALRHPFVIDNTNVTIAARQPYIEAARGEGWPVLCYFFVPDVARALERNERRTGKARIPKVGIYTANKRLQPPAYSEGLDVIYEVRLEPDQAGEKFVVTELPRA